MANRVKMDVSQRAKQFLPFAALKGLPEALERAEKEVNLSFINDSCCDTIDGDYPSGDWNDEGFCGITEEDWC